MSEFWDVEELLNTISARSGRISADADAADITAFRPHNLLSVRQCSLRHGSDGRPPQKRHRGARRGQLPFGQYVNQSALERLSRRGAAQGG